MTYVLLFIISLFLSIQLVSLIGILRKPPFRIKKWDEWPTVSVLLAARNEEDLILRSLKHLNELDYPKNKLEIWIGNDASTDKTLDKIEAFIADKPNFHVATITKNLGNGRGKANVLAQLAHKATGDFFFITDVDVAVPRQWVKRLLVHFDDTVGIVSGTTACSTKPTWFAKMQAIDWLHFMGYIKGMANHKVSCTSVGNNMAVRKTAYWETGGFENIQFSITEDYKLFEAVTLNGWAWAADLHADSFGRAWYIPSLKEVLHQRKRWLIGAQDLPFNWKFLLVLYGLFVPALIGLLFMNWEYALAAYLVKLFIQSIFIGILQRKVAIQIPLVSILIYEAYLLFLVTATAIFYFLPIKSVWKGRTYNSKNLISN